MVKRYGMSNEMGSLRAFHMDECQQSDNIRAKIDAAIDTLLNESYSRARKILIEHQDELDFLATSLLLKKTLYADEIKTLIEDYISKKKSKTENVLSTEKNGSENSFDLLASKNEVE